jgi:hypothetical protein
MSPASHRRPPCSSGHVVPVLKAARPYLASIAVTSTSIAMLGHAFRSADEAKQFEIIAALTEGTGIRATARITGVNRETVGTLALRVASVD